MAEKLAAEVLLGTTAGIWNGIPHGVLFVLTEEDPGIIKNAMRALGVSDAIMRQRLFTYVSSESQNLADSDYDTVRLPEDATFLRSECAKHDIRLIVFDALADCMEGSRLSDRGDVSRVLAPLNKWAQEDNVNRTPIIGLKKFGFDDWRCGSFVCVRIGGSTMTTGSGARR
ncbi:AAA family ATPase [Bifidobacterium dentium]